MASVRILPKRITEEEMEILPIQDGNLIFNTTDKRIYMDDEDGLRYQYGGINVVDEDFNTISRNAISNKTVTKIITEKSVTLLSSGWSTSKPFKQTIKIDGMTDNGRPNVFLEIPDTEDKDNDKILKKNYNYIDFYDTEEGGIVFTCKYTKPTIDLPILIRGVF